jgi:hypothetical protein
MKKGLKPIKYNFPFEIYHSPKNNNEFGFFESYTFFPIREDDNIDMYIFSFNEDGKENLGTLDVFLKDTYAPDDLVSLASNIHYDEHLIKKLIMEHWLETKDEINESKNFFPKKRLFALIPNFEIDDFFYFIESEFADARNKIKNLDIIDYYDHEDGYYLLLVKEEWERAGQLSGPKSINYSLFRFYPERYGLDKFEPSFDLKSNLKDLEEDFMKNDNPPFKEIFKRVRVNEGFKPKTYNIINSEYVDGGYRHFWEEYGYSYLWTNLGFLPSSILFTKKGDSRSKKIGIATSIEEARNIVRKHWLENKS